MMWRYAWNAARACVAAKIGAKSIFVPLDQALRAYRRRRTHWHDL
jgi:hypothetical protein